MPGTASSIAPPATTARPSRATRRAARFPGLPGPRRTCPPAAVARAMARADPRTEIIGTGAIIGDMDAAQLLLVGFFLFFFGLVLHLRQEDKREGYPLIDPAGGPDQVGFPPLPKPKTFHLMDGGTVTAPRPEAREPILGRPLFPSPGAPILPSGDPLTDKVGPASVGARKDRPLIYERDKIQVLPMRLLPGWRFPAGDPDPRGQPVVDAAGREVGIVKDLWIDRSVKILRYLEIETGLSETRTVLLPIYHADISTRRRRVKAIALDAARLRGIPVTREADSITAQEEDEVNAYCAGAVFFDREFKTRPAL